MAVISKVKMIMMGHEIKTVGDIDRMFGMPPSEVTVRERIDLIVCDLCKKEFDKDMEGYEISRVKFNEEFMVFDAARTQSSDWPDDSIRRVIRFHEECYEEIAGDSYRI